MSSHPLPPGNKLFFVRKDKTTGAPWGLCLASHPWAGSQNGIFQRKVLGLARAGAGVGSDVPKQVDDQVGGGQCSIWSCGVHCCPPLALVFAPLAPTRQLDLHQREIPSIDWFGAPPPPGCQNQQDLLLERGCRLLLYLGSENRPQGLLVFGFCLY